MNLNDINEGKTTEYESFIKHKGTYEIYKITLLISIPKQQLQQFHFTQSATLSIPNPLHKLKSTSYPSMIQKSLLQKSINDGQSSVLHSDKQNNPNLQQPHLFNDITNILQASQKQQDQTDYKSLYEEELILNDELMQKINLLKQKIKLLQNQNHQLTQRLQESKQETVNPSSQYFITLPKKSQKQLLFEGIRSFKSILPNSMKVIEFQELDNFDSIDYTTDQRIISQNICTSLKYVQNNQNKSSLNDQKSQKSIAYSGVTLKIINDQSLIDCLAMYGLSEELKTDEDDEQEQYYEGQLSYCSKAPHQIVKHSSKLIYPNRIGKSQVKIYQDEEAIEFAVQKISQTLKSQQIKAFTLIFEPATLPQSLQESLNEQYNDDDKQIDIIDMINKQRRFYAICVPFEDFDLIDNRKNYKDQIEQFDNSLEEDIFIKQKSICIEETVTKKLENGQTLKKVTINNIPVKSSEIDQNFSIKVSRKVITFFTKYPFIHFFEELLVHSLKQSFEHRKNQMKKNISDIKRFDHAKTIEFLKTFYQNLNLQYQLNKKFTSKLNEIFQIQYHSVRFSRFQTLSVQLSKTLIKNYYSQIWAYPVLRLFTLDNFLDVFNLVMLEQKVIFVCENESILTSAIFLFSKVFMKPFDYPYPVVSMIPNEYDYFNAPFPIIYGCLNSKENLVRQKIPKIYKNVYIIITPSGIEIMANKNAQRLTARKSPKLRDKLLPYFIKMQNQQKQRTHPRSSSMQRFSGLTSLLGFNNTFNANESELEANKKFNFSSNNRQVAHQIIDKVLNYLTQVKNQIPKRQKVEEIKKKIEEEIRMNNTAVEYQNMDIDKETYERVKNKMLKKTSDPFVQRFLETQIVGLEILR